MAYAVYRFPQRSKISSVTTSVPWPTFVIVATALRPLLSSRYVGDPPLPTVTVPIMGGVLVFVTVMVNVSFAPGFSLVVSGNNTV